MDSNNYKNTYIGNNIKKSFENLKNLDIYHNKCIVERSNSNINTIKVYFKESNFQKFKKCIYKKLGKKPVDYFYLFTKDYIDLCIRHDLI